jgi:hypothetical protein
MVDRLRDKVVVVDLDGTLVSVNTFREFVVFAACMLLGKGKIGRVCMITGAVMARKMRLISHSSMKKTVLRYVLPCLTDGEKGVFVNQLTKYTQSSVTKIIEDCKNRGYKAILATAAPEIYAVPFAEKLGFDDCVATSSTVDKKVRWKENVGNNKVDSVKNWIDKHNAVIDIVITDHHDDIPLMKYNHQGTNYLYNPSKQTIAECRGIEYTLLT